MTKVNLFAAVAGLSLLGFCAGALLTSGSQPRTLSLMMSRSAMSGDFCFGPSCHLTTPDITNNASECRQGQQLIRVSSSQHSSGFCASPLKHKGSIIIMESASHNTERAQAAVLESGMINEMSAASWNMIRVLPTMECSDHEGMEEAMKRMGVRMMGGLCTWDSVTGRVISNGDVARTLSHINVWQQMVEENVPFALVLSDRVESIGKPGLIEAALRSYLLSGEFDFLYLSRTRNDNVPETVVDSVLNLVRPELSWSVDAYVITLAGARKLLHENLLAANLVSVEEFLPIMMASTQIDQQSMPGLAKLAEFFGSMPRVEALAFGGGRMVAAGSRDMDSEEDVVKMAAQQEEESAHLRRQGSVSLLPALSTTLLQQSLLFAHTERGRTQAIDASSLLLVNSEAAEVAVEDQEVAQFVVLGLLPGRASVHQAAGLDRFVKSCHTFGVPFRLVQGDGWSALESAMAELPNQDTRSVVLVVDATTTLLNAAPATLLQRFREVGDTEYDDRVILAAEKMPAGEEAAATSGSSSATKLRYTMAGAAMMGTLPGIRRLMVLGKLVEEVSDRMESLADMLAHHRAYFEATAMADSSLLRLDTGARLFQSLVGESTSTFSVWRFYARLHNRLTDTQPLVILSGGDQDGSGELLLSHLANKLAFNGEHVLGHHPTRPIAMAKALLSPAQNGELTEAMKTADCREETLEDESRCPYHVQMLLAEKEQEMAGGCPRLVVFVALDADVTNEQMAAFTAGLQRQDLPRQCVRLRFFDLRASTGEEEEQEQEQDGSPADARLRAMRRDDGWAEVAVDRSGQLPLLRTQANIRQKAAQGLTAMAASRALQEASSGRADFVLLLSPQVILTEPSALRQLLYDNAPGVSTLAMQPATGSATTFIPRLDDDSEETAPAVEKTAATTLQQQILQRRSQESGLHFHFYSTVTMPCIQHLLMVPADFASQISQALFDSARHQGPAQFCEQMRDRSISMWVYFFSETYGSLWA